MKVPTPWFERFGLESLEGRELVAIFFGWVGAIVYSLQSSVGWKPKIAILALSTIGQIFWAGVAAIDATRDRARNAQPSPDLTAAPTPEHSLARWDDLNYGDRYKIVASHLDAYLAVRGLAPTIPERAKLIARVQHALDTHSYSPDLTRTIGQGQALRNALARELPDLPEIAIADNPIAAPANADSLTLGDWRGLPPADQYAIAIATIRDRSLVQPSIDRQVATTIAYLDALDPTTIAAAPDDNLIRYVVGLNEEFATQ